MKNRIIILRIHIILISSKQILVQLYHDINIYFYVSTRFYHYSLVLIELKIITLNLSQTEALHHIFRWHCILKNI